MPCRNPRPSPDAGLPGWREWRELLAGAAQHGQRLDRALADDRPLGAFVGYVLDGTGERPAGPWVKAVSDFERLERFLESRLRRET